MRDECDIIIEKINTYAEAQYKMWYTVHKPFGWETLDLRYGGLMHRFGTVKKRLTAYLVGEVDKLEELEAERLRYDCRTDDYRLLAPRFMLLPYNRVVTANKL